MEIKNKIVVVTGANIYLPKGHAFLFPLVSDPILMHGKYQSTRSPNWTGGNQQKYMASG